MDRRTKIRLLDFFESIGRLCIEGISLVIVFLIGIYVVIHVDILSEHGFEVMLSFKDILYNAIWFYLLILGLSIIATELLDR